MRWLVDRSITVLRLIFSICALIALLNAAVYAGKKNNGFDLQSLTIPRVQVHAGGPPRDGIPALTTPLFIKAEDATLSDDARVLALDFNGVVKAYPVNILDYHELVNDDFDGTPVLISFCPLCGTGMAFLSSVDGQVLEFGVSGLLYNSDVLMYDRQTESLWSQIMQKAVSGPMAGTKLQLLSVEHTTWGDWRRRYPTTQLLSEKTGYLKNYQQSPYAGYSEKRKVYFPIQHNDKRFHPKEVVVGVSLDGIYKAYPFVELGKTSQPLNDKIGSHEIQVVFDKENRSARVFDQNGTLIPSLTSFWFAWYAFHPNTEVFEAPALSN